MKLEEAQCVVELGPGTGAFTNVILSRLNPEAVFFAIERNPALASFLRRELPNVEIICDSAENLGDYLKSRNLTADYVLSGLPLSWLPKEVCHNVLDAVHASLRPSGKFAMFQYIHSAMTPTGAYVQQALKNRFGNLHISRTFRNLPPALALICEKTD
ncbi:MAG: methyltransferase domain-containing protein [Acidobacteria bacterium]|nr:methyltransferase domain-containing protein [Acidobacteriota bacterium]